MANSYFEVDVGVNVGGVRITGTSGNITTSGSLAVGNVTVYAANGSITSNGNITTTGNITINSTAYNMSANSVVQKSYVDNIAVVFGI
jgi:hypothetical protein